MSELILTPEQQIKLDQAADLATKSMQRSEIEKHFRQDLAARVKEEIGVATSNFNRLVNQRHSAKSSQNIEKEQETIELEEMLKTARRNAKAVEQQKAQDGTLKALEDYDEPTESDGSVNVTNDDDEGEDAERPW